MVCSGLNPTLVFTIRSNSKNEIRIIPSLSLSNLVRWVIEYRYSSQFMKFYGEDILATTKGMTNKLTATSWNR